MTQPPGSANDESLVIVEHSLDAELIEALRARLEAEGIPALAADSGINQLNPLYSIAVGGVRLMVPREKADEARRLIALIKSGRLAARDDDVNGGQP